MIDRKEIASYIIRNLRDNKESLSVQFTTSEKKIGYFYLDAVLSTDLATTIFENFPNSEEVVQKKSLKEHKHVAAQMDKYHPLLEETIYAFQEPEVVKIIEEICGLENLQPDANLYAGGLSMMGKNNFLNPHLDNSHDKDRNLWRALNLLYYVTPNWEERNGGNLELWPNGPKEIQNTIHAKFNRLVVMATHTKSWHSVSKVEVDKLRCCVSNYYFSEVPIDNDYNFHVTTFRGRPEQKLRNKVLKIDSFLRMQIRKIFKKGLVENPHVYKRKEEE